MPSWKNGSCGARFVRAAPPVSDAAGTVPSGSGARRLPAEHEPVRPGRQARGPLDALAEVGLGHVLPRRDHAVGVGGRPERLRARADAVRAALEVDPAVRGEPRHVRPWPGQVGLGAHPPAVDDVRIRGHGARAAEQALLHGRHGVAAAVPPAHHEHVVADVHRDPVDVLLEHRRLDGPLLEGAGGAAGLALPDRLRRRRAVGAAHQHDAVRDGRDRRARARGRELEGVDRLPLRRACRRWRS